MRVGKPVSFNTQRLDVKTLTVDDCDECYVNWLNDSEVNQFLEIRFCYQTMKIIRYFVDAIYHSNDSCLFGIYKLNGDHHIGNVKLGPINYHHNFADISYFIGEKSEWGKGYASEVIRAILDFGFRELGLFSIQAGVYANNVGSLRALQKAGFRQEACFKNKLLYNGVRVDHIIFSINRLEAAL